MCGERTPRISSLSAPLSPPAPAPDRAPPGRAPRVPRALAHAPVLRWLATWLTLRHPPAPAAELDALLPSILDKVFKGRAVSAALAEQCASRTREADAQRDGRRDLVHLRRRQ